MPSNYERYDVGKTTGGHSTTGCCCIVGTSDDSRHLRKSDSIVIAVIFTVFSWVFLIVFVVLIINLPPESGLVCNDIYSVSVGQQPQCRLFSSDADAFVFSEYNTTAYQYRPIDLMNLETEVRNISFTYHETVDSESFVVFNSSVGVGRIIDYHVGHFHYKLSSPADIYVFDIIGLEDFVYENRILTKPLMMNKSVTDWEYTYNGTVGIHVVVSNVRNTSLSIYEEGWVSKEMYIMDKTKALFVCNPGEQCRVNNTESCVFILDYGGDNRTVPVTMLKEYGHYAMLFVYVYFPLVFVGFLIGAVVFFYYAHRIESDNKKPQTSGGELIDKNVKTVENKPIVSSYTGQTDTPPTPGYVISDVYAIPMGP